MLSFSHLFKKTWQMNFQIFLTILHFNQQCMSNPVSLYSCQHLLMTLLFFFNISHSGRYAMIYLWFLTCISLHLITFNFFPCANFPSIYFLHQNVFSCLLSIFYCVRVCVCVRVFSGQFWQKSVYFKYYTFLR